LGKQNPFIGLNNLFKYNINTNKATRKKGTMLTCSLGFKQIGQGVSEKLA